MDDERFFGTDADLVASNQRIADGIRPSATVRGPLFGLAYRACAGSITEQLEPFTAFGEGFTSHGLEAGFPQCPLGIKTDRVVGCSFPPHKSRVFFCGPAPVNPFDVDAYIDMVGKRNGNPVSAVRHADAVIGGFPIALQAGGAGRIMADLQLVCLVARIEPVQGGGQSATGRARRFARAAGSGNVGNDRATFLSPGLRIQGRDFDDMTGVQTGMRLAYSREQWASIPYFIECPLESVGYTNVDTKGKDTLDKPGLPSTFTIGARLMGFLNRAWRLLATGISFSLFGIAGLLTGLLVFPALFLVIRDPVTRQNAARATVGWLFGAFIKIMSWLGVLSYTVTGRNEVSADDTYLIVANHPTLIDVVFLVWLFPQSECVVKEAVVRNPFMRSVVLAANYISNDDPLLLIQKCVERLKQGSSLILFPEGTRSVPGRERVLKPGAAAVAVRSGATLLPVTFSCVPATLAKHESWYEIPPRKPIFTVEVLEPLPLADIVPENTELREGTRIVNERLASLFDDHCPVQTSVD